MSRFLEDFLHKDKISSLLCKKRLSVEASSRLAQNYAEIATALESLGHAPNAHVRAVWVPGRIEVLGKHTDYAGGMSLLVAVERGFAVLVMPLEQQEISVFDVVRGEMVSIDAHGQAERNAPAWAVYPQTTIKRLINNFGPIGQGGLMAFISDLPVASGMSSSSAFIIATYLAIQTLFNFHESTSFKSAVVDRAQLADYLGHVENGQTYKHLAGDRGVGTFGGSQDHTAILCSHAQEIMHVGFGPTEVLGYTKLDDDTVFCIASSGVKAEKTEGAKLRYNQATSLASQVVEFWNQQNEVKTTDLATIVQSPSFEKESFLKRLKEHGHLAERFEQFYNETSIYIPAAIRALESGNQLALGQVVAASQADAKEKLRNQIPETIYLAGAARELGAYAASAFGAGFGGAVWALVAKARADQFLENWSRAYAGKYPQHKEAEFFKDETGPAAFVF